MCPDEQLSWKVVSSIHRQQGLHLSCLNSASKGSERVTQTSQSQHTKEMLRHKTWVIIPEQNAGTSLLSLWLGQGFEVGLVGQAQLRPSPID